MKFFITVIAILTILFLNGCAAVRMMGKVATAAGGVMVQSADEEEAKKTKLKNEPDIASNKAPTRLVTTDNKTLAAETIAQAQNRLLEFGYDIGEADGVYGRKTKIAIKKYQLNKGIAVTGMFDAETLALLGVTR